MLFLGIYANLIEIAFGAGVFFLVVLWTGLKWGYPLEVATEAGQDGLFFFVGAFGR